MDAFTWSTNARVSDIGPEGSVRAACLVDWMQEAASLHCDHVGWSVDRLRDEGFLWFVRGLVLVRRAPIYCRDEVTVETWVSDRGRFRTHREYRVRRGEEVVACAQADWLFLARTKAGGVRPTRFPPAMVAAFAIEPETALEGVQVPEWSADLDQSSALHRQVVPSELDGNGHVNHTIYLDWLADGYARAQRPVPGILRLEYVKDANDGDPVDVFLGAEGAEIRSADTTLLRAASRD